MPLYLRFWRYFIICFLLSFPVFAQENFLETYHPSRNKAEMAIVADDYKTASQHYATAFKSVKNPLAKDIFNAMVCHLLVDDFETAKKYLIKLAGKGISLKYLEDNAIFGIEKYASFLDENKILYKNIQDLLIKDEIENILEKKAILKTFEPELIKQDNSSNSVTRFYGLSPQKTAEAQKHIIENGIINEEESFLIKNLIEKETENDAVIMYDRNKFNHNASLNLLDNYTYFGRTATKEDSLQKSEIDEKIMVAVKNGILNPVYAIEKSNIYSTIYNQFDNEMLQLSISEDSNCVLYKKNIYLKKRIFTSRQIADYDNLMAQFGIENLNDKFKKDVYAYKKNKYFAFPNHLRFELLSVSNCEEAEKELVEFDLWDKK